MVKMPSEGSSRVGSGGKTRAVQPHDKERKDKLPFSEEGGKAPRK